MDLSKLDEKEKAEYQKLEKEYTESINLVNGKHKAIDDVIRIIHINQDYLRIIDEFGDNIGKISRLTPIAIIEIKDVKLDIKMIKEKIKKWEQDIKDTQVFIQKENKNIQAKEKKFIECKHEVARKIKARTYKDEQRQKRQK